MDWDEGRVKVLDAADALFYGRGLQSVGMTDIRDQSGVSLKRLYQYFPSKDELVAAYLTRRDQQWRSGLRDFINSRSSDPRERILAIFDSLEEWFNDPCFRGCAYINAFGEWGAVRPAIARITMEHKRALRGLVMDLLEDAGVDDPEVTARRLMILIDGAMTSAALHDSPNVARQARDMAVALLQQS